MGGMGMCLAQGGVWCEWIRGLGLGFINPVGTGDVWDMSLGCGGVGDVGGELVGLVIFRNRTRACR